MTELLKIQGNVESIRKDRKGVKLNDGHWYSGFKELTVNKGDFVTIEYKLNGEYRNIVNFTNDKPMTTFQKEAREDKATSMLTAYVKDLAVAYLNQGKDFTEEHGKLMSNWVADWYNIIKKKINDSELQDKQV